MKFGGQSNLNAATQSLFTGIALMRVAKVNPDKDFLVSKMGYPDSIKEPVYLDKIKVDGIEDEIERIRIDFHMIDNFKTPDQVAIATKLGYTPHGASGKISFWLENRAAIAQDGRALYTDPKAAKLLYEDDAKKPEGSYPLMQGEFSLLLFLKTIMDVPVSKDYDKLQEFALTDSREKLKEIILNGNISDIDKIVTTKGRPVYGRLAVQDNKYQYVHSRVANHWTNSFEYMEKDFQNAIKLRTKSKFYGGSSLKLTPFVPADAMTDVSTEQFNTSQPEAGFTSSATPDNLPF